MRLRLVAATLVAATAMLCAGPAAAQSLKLEWNVEGYYRTRAVSLTNLAHEPRRVITALPGMVGTELVLPDIRSTSYVTQRLRLSPTVKVSTIAKLFFEINAFDDVLFGDNNAISTAPLFAVNGSNQNFLGGKEQGSVNFTRAWVEFQVPVGIMRVGRMPSHWGMGILANGGGSGNWDPLSPDGEPRRKNVDYYFDDDFGDNHFGSTNDRILFATKPLSIYKTIKKIPDTSSNFVLAYAFDKLSEAPFLFTEDDYRFRPFGLQGFLSRGEKQDDVNEHVFVAAYSNPDWDQVRYSDELKIGTYWVIRDADQGFTKPSEFDPPTIPCADQMDPPESCVDHDEGSFVWIADFWYRVRYGNYYSEAEVVHIGGESTGGVPFPGANARKKADIDGGVFRAGYMTDKLDGILELGYSSGDNDMNDINFRQRALHPDFNVGLILFEEILRERTARTFGPPLIGPGQEDGARGLMSNGGVINAKYVQPKVRWRPDFGGVEIVGAVLFAWLDEWADVTPGVFPCDNAKRDPMTTLCPDSGKYLGTEFDVAIKSRFADGYLDFSLEAGYLMFGEALKLQSGGNVRPGDRIADAASGSFSLQARVGFVF